MSQSIRIVVANRPRLMRELVIETISDQADMEIVAEILNEDEIAGIVDGTHPDFLIVALDDSDRRPLICDDLLRRYPDMKILALAPERNHSVLFWVSSDIHESQVEASEAGILSTLRRRSQSVVGG
jgi:DNA-binding NarL/FixJ family response regulator